MQSVGWEGGGWGLPLAFLIFYKIDTIANAPILEFQDPP